jgi:adenine phosphoribosyltransferase
MHSFIYAFGDKETVGTNGRKRILSPLTELVPQTDPKLLRECATYLAKLIPPERKIVSEEHGAGHIAGGLSYLNGNDLAIARWTPDELAQSLVPYFGDPVPYRGGNLVLQGVKRGEKVDIVDDVMDRGETLEAMIGLIERNGGEIGNIYVVAEKTYHGKSHGRERLAGYSDKIHSLLEVEVAGRRSHIRKPNLPAVDYYLPWLFP